MQCRECEKDKEVSSFRIQDNDLCIQCERELTYQRMKKYQESNIGLENLDTSLENIFVKSKYLIYTSSIPLEKAIKLVENNKAHVYKPDMIYRLDPEEDSWVVKLNVLERDSYKCHYCKEYGDTVDHIIPRSEGGKYTEENLVCSCKNCNYARKTLPYQEFKQNWFEIKQKFLQNKIDKQMTKQRNRELHERQYMKRKKNRMPKSLLKQRQKYDWT